MIIFSLFKLRRQGMDSVARTGSSTLSAGKLVTIGALLPSALTALCILSNCIRVLCS